ncbi:hypothetical protein R6Q59_027108 [Mikania micrantha]|uniref:Uncharacterized protein n=1 Tax=Mikania micrantha TaxID=192012 RepID=A0A5N6MCM1_9ASTR|nr:hypothetical protein E3N88_33677 [Mikania micrantha]
MGRAPCCEKIGLRRGRWTAEEDEKLSTYIEAHGEGSWRSLPKNAGLLRCGKSCRLRWINYLRSDVKRGNISAEEEDTIVKLHASFGNRWSLIAGHLSGRTDNEIKNYWNSHLSRKLTPSNPKIIPTKRWSSATKNMKPPKTTTASAAEKQVNMINSSFGGGGDVETVPDSFSSSSSSGGEKENKLDDCFNNESLIIDPTDQVLLLTDDHEDLILNMNSSSSSTNGGSQVDPQVDWGWEWDFEGVDSLVGLGIEEEDDDIMSWPWEISTEEPGVVDEQKQDSMIAWLLS